MTLLKEAVVPIGSVIFAAIYIGFTRGMPPESIIFPQTVLVALVILSAIVMVTEYRTSKTMQKLDAPAKSRALLLLGLSAAFVVGFAFVGFVISSLVFLIITMVILGRSLVSSVIISVLLTGAIYGLFSEILGIML